jgi:hypothetical protein
MPSFYGATRHSNGYHEGRDIFVDQATCSNNAFVANSYSTEYCGGGADPYTILDCDVVRFTCAG